MKIQTLETKVLKTKGDICRIIQSENMLAIGSVTIEKTEAAEYLETLRQAFAEFGVLTNTGQEKA